MDKTSSHEVAENRASVRFPVVLFVEFEHGSGWTRDISTTGVCIETDRLVACGAAIRFYLHQPDHPGSVTKMECNGVVVRAEQQGAAWRLGVQLDRIRFDAYTLESVVPPPSLLNTHKSETSRNRISRFNFFIGKRGEMS